MDCTALGTRKYGPVVPIFRKGIKMVAISGGKEKRKRSTKSPSAAAAYLILTSFESQSW